MCGLEINKTKSSCIIYNEKNKPESIRGITVTEKMKYLGVIINDKVECFKEHKTDKITLCKKMANMTYSVTARACNKLLIGKTFWKSVVQSPKVVRDHVPCMFLSNELVTLTVGGVNSTWNQGRHLGGMRGANGPPKTSVLPAHLAETSRVRGRELIWATVHV